MFRGFLFAKCMLQWSSNCWPMPLGDFRNRISMLYTKVFITVKTETVVKRVYAPLWKGFYAYAAFAARKPRSQAQKSHAKTHPKPPAGFLFENLSQNSDLGFQIWPWDLPREVHQKRFFNGTFRILHNTTLSCTSLHTGYRSCSWILRCRAFNAYSFQ